MRLTRVSAQNWMAYEDLDLDLAGISQVAITGLNNHGKSAILDGVLWCLYGKVGREMDARGSDNLIRRGTQDMVVRVEFVTPAGQTVSVTREKSVGKGGTLSLVVDGTERKAHTIAETEKAVVGMVGLDVDALLVGPFMVQEQSSSFMRAQPRERKDVLMRLLGLDEYEVLWRIAKDLQADATRERGVIERAIETSDHEAAKRPGVEAMLLDAQEAYRIAVDLSSQYRAKADAYATELADLRVEAQQLQGNVALAKRAREEGMAIATRLDLIGSQHTAPQAILAMTWAEPPTQLAPSPQEVEEASRAATAASEAAQSYERAQGRVAILQERLGNMAEQRLTLSAVPCGGAGEYAACPFLTRVPNLHAVEVAGLELQEAQGSVSTWAEVAGQMGILTQRHRDLLGQQHAASLRDARREADLATFVQRQETSKARLADLAKEEAALRERAAVVTGEMAAYDMLDTALRELTIRGVGLKTALDQTRAEEKAFADRATLLGPTVRQHEGALAIIAHAESEGARLRKDRDVQRAKEETFGLLAAAWHRDGIPTSIIERSLPLIESRANDVLGRLPEDLSVSLRTQRPVNKGKGMAETLDVIVTIDGWESDYALLSVGARFRVDLALRLALGQVLTHRGGGSIETLWLDEPLAALDGPGREAAVSTLGALAADFGLIVVVSHHADFNDVFAARVAVTKEGGVSNATLVS
jgi:DNA repair exonuclease SbcCD ATPase subunit